MPGRLTRWLDARARRRAARQWGLLGHEGARPRGARLRRLHAEADALRRDLDRFLVRSRRLQDDAAAMGEPIDLPAGTDWRWRPGFLTSRLTPTGRAAPEPGAQLGAETAIWHDCPARALILRQIPNRGAEDLARYGLRLETLGFSGSFLSLSVDLPAEALQGLGRSHIIRVDASLSVERPMSIYARLNITHGPDTDDLLRHLGDIPAGVPHAASVEFDLHYLQLNERRLEKLWLDLIFERPTMNAVTLRDMFLSRHLRADI